MQMAVLWIMVLMASTWDITGGQMGYNLLVTSHFLVSECMFQPLFRCRCYDLAEFTASYGAIKPVFTEEQYYTGLYGIISAGLVCAVVVCLLGLALLG